MKALVTFTCTMEVEAEHIDDLKYKVQENIDQIEDLYNAEIFNEDTNIEFDDDTPIDDKIEEIRSDFHNDDEGYTSIDVWFIGSDDGFVAAHVYDSGTVEWIDTECSNSTKVAEEIFNVINDLNKDE